MPDLKSELMKLPDLSKLSFDDPGEPDMQTTTTAHHSSLGVSETFFNLIRDNPGLHRSQLVDMAEQAGVTRSSSSSLIVQFTKRGLIEAAKNGSVSTYTTVGNHYVKGYVARDKAKKVKRVAKVTPEPTPAPDNSLRVVETVPELLNALSIVQARELYDALKKIFGA